MIDVANATPPTATTGSAVAVHRTSATITGIVDTVGQPTSYHFEWGPDVRYAHRTPEVSLGSGAARVPVAKPLTGLKQGTAYHYRLVAQCVQLSCGYATSNGADGLLTTLFPRAVAATFGYGGKWRRTYSIFTSLVVKGIPSGGRVELRCAGRGCPFGRRAFRARSHIEPPASSSTDGCGSARG